MNHLDLWDSSSLVKLPPLQDDVPNLQLLALYGCRSLRELPPMQNLMQMKWLGVPYGMLTDNQIEQLRKQLPPRCEISIEPPPESQMAPTTNPTIHPAKAGAPPTGDSR